MDTIVFPKYHTLWTPKATSSSTEKEGGSPIPKSNNGKIRNIKSNKRERSTNIKDVLKVIYFTYFRSLDFLDHVSTINLAPCSY